jgi:atypical dual specificity phosphatase
MKMVQAKRVPAFELSDASVHGPMGSLLVDQRLEVPDRSVTVLLGPAGAGKSTLLRLLSGQAPRPAWSARGTWRYRGNSLTHAWRADRVLPGIHWVGQCARDADPVQVSEHFAATMEILESDADTVLLDEPDRRLDESQKNRLAEALRGRTGARCVVLVTHDLAFARKVAEHAVLICAGNVEANLRAKDFFEHPPTELVSRFVCQGNCWPTDSGPPLPTHFRWILPDRLAGMGVPGLLGEAASDLEAIARAGITRLISLTETAFPMIELRHYGIQGRHMPIPDMGVPAIGKTATLCRAIEREMERGEGVAVHCRAGVGRTGTILASTLVWLGRTPEQAIAEIRAIGPSYIQTQTQLQFVHRFAESV